MMITNCDVLIVGAGTTGIYFGWLMAKRGHSVLIIDKDARDEVGQRLEVIHFDQKMMEELYIPPPREPPELITLYKGVYVSRLPLFLQRMYQILEAHGVQFEFSCNFKELMFENQRIIGAKVEKNAKAFDIIARLVVDASGIACAVRSTLPDDYGVETWKYDSNNRFFVILHYIKWSKPDEPHPEWGEIRPYYFLFFDPGYTKDEAIMGIAGPESFEKAGVLVDEILEREKFPPYELKKKEYGSFPYARPPYSLVGDGFFCAGDSAAITHPIASRGILETWTLCKKVEDVFDSVLKKGIYLSRELLWETNVRHFRGDGAELAYLYMLSSTIYGLPEKNLNYLFSKLRPIIDPPREPTESADFKLSKGKIAKLIFKVLGGIFIGKVSIHWLFKLLKTNRQANKIKKHYTKYPENPKDFKAWMRKAKEIWKYRKRVMRRFKSDIATYP